MSTPAPTTTIVATETVHLTIPLLVGQSFLRNECQMRSTQSDFVDGRTDPKIFPEFLPPSPY